MTVAPKRLPMRGAMEQTESTCPLDVLVYVWNIPKGTVTYTYTYYERQ
jgi:hypothetical protein